MPSPGGGSRGGGFRGGSRGGGSFRGGFRGGHRPGGFHGHHHHHHHHHRPFFGFFRPYYGYRYGGIYHGGLLSALFVPIFTLIFVLLLLVGFVGSMFTRQVDGYVDNEFAYDEKALQDYALKQYAKEFNDSTAYEDNILIVFLVNEERTLYDTIAIIGDNIADPIYNMFGNEYTEFGSEMQTNIADYYENSLSRNMAGAIAGMQKRIVNLGLSSNFVSPSKIPSGTEPHFTNHTSISISADVLNPTLDSFTEATNIPIAIVFEDFSDVYESDPQAKAPGSFDFGDFITVAVILLFGAVGIYTIRVTVKNYKSGKNQSSAKESDSNDNNGPKIDPDEDKKNNSTHW